MKQCYCDYKDDMSKFDLRAAPSPVHARAQGTAHTLRTPACEMHGVVCLVRSAQPYAVRCDSRAAWTVAADPTADRDRGDANLGVSAPGLLPLSSVVCT